MMKNSPKTIKPSQLILLLVIVGLAAFLRTQGYGPAAATPTSQPPLPVEALPTTAPAEMLPEASVTPEATLKPVPTEQANPASSLTGKLAEFDYFVLALSWSPDYCAANGQSDPQQCSLGKKLGFVLHGLWPQDQKGYPSNCSAEKMPQSAKEQFPGLYPNDKLFDHEWEKHGTCTGLTPVEYLQLGKELKAAVAIPAEFRSPEKAFRSDRAGLKTLFSAANPGFDPAAFEVSCSGSGRYLKEIYVCFARDGQPTACSAEMQKNAQKSCQAADFIVRNTR